MPHTPHTRHKLLIAAPACILGAALGAFFGALAPIVEWGLFASMPHPTTPAAILGGTFGFLSGILWMQLLWEDRYHPNIFLRATRHGALCGLLVAALLHAILLAGSGGYADSLIGAILAILVFGGIGGIILGAVCELFADSTLIASLSATDSPQPDTASPPLA